MKTINLGLALGMPLTKTQGQLYVVNTVAGFDENFVFMMKKEPIIDELNVTNYCRYTDC
jgi:hypothetical protein